MWKSNVWGSGTPEVCTAFVWCALPEYWDNYLSYFFLEEKVIEQLSDIIIRPFFLCLFTFDTCSRQNVDLTRKYENCMKEVDYYKKQERAAYTALQNLRMQYEEVIMNFFYASAFMHWKQHVVIICLQLFMALLLWICLVAVLCFTMVSDVNCFIVWWILKLI